MLAFIKFKEWNKFLSIMNMHVAGISKYHGHLKIDFSYAMEGSQITTGKGTHLWESLAF